MATLPPTSHRRAFVVAGLIVQLVAVAIPTAYIAYRTEHTQAVISKATLLLVGRHVVHSHNGVLIVVAAAVLFAVGSVLLARPFVRSWLTLGVAVPVAGVVGLLVLGIGALVLALLVYAVFDTLDLSDVRTSKGKRRRLRS